MADTPTGPETPNEVPGATKRPSWTFLTNHGHVLLSVAANPDIRVAEIADRVGITPRAALQILKDLEDGGYLHRTRVGRRTSYSIEPHQHFRHPTTATQEIGGLIRLFSGPQTHTGAPRPSQGMEATGKPGPP